MPRPKPDVSYSAFSVRIQDELLAVIREIAKQEKRSVNAQIDLILEEWVKRKTRRAANKTESRA